MSKIENLNFYIVEDGYIEYASRWDHHIAYNKNNKRPYVGIVFKINVFSYFSPIMYICLYKADIIVYNYPVVLLRDAVIPA